MKNIQVAKVFLGFHRLFRQLDNSYHDRDSVLCWPECKERIFIHGCGKFASRMHLSSSFDWINKVYRLFWLYIIVLF